MAKRSNTAATKFIGELQKNIEDDNTNEDVFKNEVNNENEPKVIYVEVKPETRSKRFPLLLPPSKFQRLESLVASSNEYKSVMI